MYGLLQAVVTTWRAPVMLSIAVMACMPAHATDAQPDVAAVAATPPALPQAALVPAGPVWSLALPANDPVVFRGMVNYDQAGMGASAFMYPAPGLAGLLVAVATHGVIVESAKNSQKSKLQEDADRVLLPYKDALAGYTHGELLRRTLARSPGGRPSSDSDTAAAGIWKIQSLPTFRMTQDQRAIILDNTVSLQAPGSAEPVKTQVMVISAAVKGDDPSAWWMADSGHRLKDESAALVAESLETALAHLQRSAVPGQAAASESPYRTVKYLEGSVQRVERAQVILQRCDRMLVKTLRGDLMSIPIDAASAPPESCG